MHISFNTARMTEVEEMTAENKIGGHHANNLSCANNATLLDRRKERKNTSACETKNGTRGGKKTRVILNIKKAR